MERVSEQYKRIHFAVMAVEGSAAKAGVEGQEMYRRLKECGLLEDHILEFSDILHTQSLEYVVDDVLEALSNRTKIR